MDNLYGVFNLIFLIAIDIGLAASGDVFQAEVDRYIRDLRDTHNPVPGTDRIRLPGHIE